MYSCCSVEYTLSQLCNSASCFYSIYKFLRKLFSSDETERRIAIPCMEKYVMNIKVLRFYENVFLIFCIRLFDDVHIILGKRYVDKFWYLQYL